MLSELGFDIISKILYYLKICDWVNLTHTCKDNFEIWKKMRKDYRYIITKCEKEHLVTKCNHGTQCDDLSTKISIVGTYSNLAEAHKRCAYLTSFSKNKYSSHGRGEVLDIYYANDRFKDKLYCYIYTIHVVYVGK
jgi:hypothetical protein